MKLQDHINQVEEYGLVRSQFPVSFNGHTVSILKNDATREKRGRIAFHFLLYCEDCKTESSISGRFSASDDEQIKHVSNAKVAAFHEFICNCE